MIEDVVVAEAQAQISHLSYGVRQKANLSEVAAYALNRLPPLYAGTERGWLQQRRQAHYVLKEQIAATVQEAIGIVSLSSLRHTTPLPQEDRGNGARCLAQLQKILGKPNLQWKDVPSAVAESLGKARYGEKAFIYLSRNKRQVLGIQNSLQGQPGFPSDLSQAKSDPLEAQEFESYMLTASCFFINVLEQIVIETTHKQMERLGAFLARKAKPTDVAVYALNRLSPMYATSIEGETQQRQRANVELADEVVYTVIQSLVTLTKLPKRLIGPLPVTKFEQDREQALIQLRQILHRDDITHLNVANLVSEALGKARYMVYS